MKDIKFAGYYPTRGKAVLAARAMRRLLYNPKGWKITTWCSEPRREHWHLGMWFAALRNGPMSLYYHDGTGFSALLGDSLTDSIGGCPQWTDSYHHRDPNMVIANQCRIALRVIAKYRQVEKFLKSL